MKKSERLDVLIDWLYARINYERQDQVTPDSFKLQTMRHFVDRLGNPHLKYPVIHVAGTKGKGSVSTMIGQILSTTGRKTGVYVSPHLDYLNQRIIINGVPISDDDLVQTLSEIQPFARDVDAAAISNPLLRPLTFFEIITAAAFYYFAQQQVDVAVIEVGLGGRLDSTNICQPVVSVITNISFDHTQQLGDTLAKIAFEKAGIIKPTTPVISGATTPEAANVIQSVAQERSAELRQLARDFHIREGLTPSTFSWNTALDSETKTPYRIENIQLGMIGKHQQYNAALAIAVCQKLNQQAWHISENSIREGLRITTLPGRTEIVSRNPTVLLDIAHNQASIEALVNTLIDLAEWQSSHARILIMSVSKEKALEQMMTAILPHFDTFIFTSFSCNPRARPPQELLNMARELQQKSIGGNSRNGLAQFHTKATSQEALEFATSIASENDFICISGSAFLVADLRPKLKYSRTQPV